MIRLRSRTRFGPVEIFLIALISGLSRAEEWAPPPIRLTPDRPFPRLACNQEELARLRAAYLSSRPEHDLVAQVVAAADRSVRQPVTFPPRGGQHNQWYQCETCQLALATVDAHHHRCGRCGKVYSGEPYDDVVYSRTHGLNLKALSTAAWAHAITNEQKYATFAASILRGYAQRYREYPYHSASRTRDSWGTRSGGHLFEQTLTEASAFTRHIAPAYDLVHESSALSEADHEAIRDGLINPLLRNVDRNKAGKSNWQTWHNAAMLCGGVLLGDEQWVRKAIEDPKNGFAYQMQVSVSADGMWYENSWGYHFYTLSAMIEIAEVARRQGIDLWSHPTLAKMFTVATEYAMPGGLLPRFGDDVNTRVDRAAAGLEYLYHAQPSPDLPPYLPERISWTSVLLGREVRPRPPPPRPRSRVFSSAGHAILRTRSEKQLAAALTFGPYGGFHGHLDKLSFVLFGHGEELGVDPGRARSQAYRLPIHRRWYKATISHNAVVVDGAAQRPAEGRLELFAANADYAVVVASCDTAYEGIRHRRLIFLAPEYLLVTDDLRGDSERRFDWIYHNRGSAAKSAVVAAATTPALSYPGQEYLENLRRGTSDGPVRIEFPGRRVTTHVLLAAAPATEIWTGDGPGASVLDRVPLVVVTRRGQSAKFAAVIEPRLKESAPRTRNVRLEASGGTLEVTVEREGGGDAIRIEESQRLTVHVDGLVVLTGEP